MNGEERNKNRKIFSLTAEEKKKRNKNYIQIKDIFLECEFSSVLVFSLHICDMCIGETSILRHYLAFLRISFNSILLGSLASFSSVFSACSFGSRFFFAVFNISLQPSQKFVFDVQKLTT